MIKLFVLSIIVSIAKSQQPIYAQCDGMHWNGGKTCASGLTCQFINQYYSQCLPGLNAIIYKNVKNNLSFKRKQQSANISNSST